jgi:hypothetical protein
MRKGRYFIKERTALINAALTLVSEGRFHLTQMTEIAHRARLAESTSLIFYENKEILEKELSEHILEKINAVFTDSIQKTTNTRTQFLILWNSLFHFYVNNRAAMMYIDHASTPYGKKLQETVRANVDHFFAQFFSTAFSKRAANGETLAFLFHSNVISAVKLHDYNLTPFEEIEKIPEMLWIAFGTRLEKRETVL